MTDNGKYLQYYKCMTWSILWFINMNLSKSKYQFPTIINYSIYICSELVCLRKSVDTKKELGSRNSPRPIQNFRLFFLFPLRQADAKRFTNWCSWQNC